MINNKKTIIAILLWGGVNVYGMDLSVNDLNAKVAELELENQDILTQYEGVFEANKKRRQKIKRLKASLKELEKEKVVSDNTWQTQYSEQSKNLEVANQSLQEAQTELAMIKSQYEKKTQECEALNLGLGDLNAKAAELELENQDILTQYERVFEANKKRIKEIKTLKASLKELKKEKVVNTWQTQYSEQSKNLEVANQSLQEAQTELAMIKSQYEKKTQECEALNLGLGDLKRSLQQAQAERHNQCHELQALSLSLKEKRDQLHQARDQLHLHQASNDLKLEQTKSQQQMQNIISFQNSLKNKLSNTKLCLGSTGLCFLSASAGFLGAQYFCGQNHQAQLLGMGAASVGATALGALFMVKKAEKEYFREEDIESKQEKSTHKPPKRTLSDVFRMSWIKKGAMSFCCFGTALSSVLYKDVIINWGKAGGSKVMDFFANLRKS